MARCLERVEGPENALLHAFLGLVDAYRDKVPTRFLPIIDAPPVARTLEPQSLSCLRWLDAIGESPLGAASDLVALLRTEKGALRWGQTYRADDFGAAFLENYGWLEVFGARGHFVHGEVAGGLLLLGPETLYPDHHHVAEEVYIPLTDGSAWRMGDGPFRPRGAGEVIFHASNASHAMRTAERPLLALYLWHGGPLDQKSTFGVSSGG